jgi:hypothetical protein
MGVSTGWEGGCAGAWRQAVPLLPARADAPGALARPGSWTRTSAILLGGLGDLGGGWSGGGAAAVGAARGWC